MILSIDLPLFTRFICFGLWSFVNSPPDRQPRSVQTHRVIFMRMKNCVCLPWHAYRSPWCSRLSTFLLGHMLVPSLPLIKRLFKRFCPREHNIIPSSNLSATTQQRHDRVSPCVLLLILHWHNSIFTVLSVSCIFVWTCKYGAKEYSKYIHLLTERRALQEHIY